MYVCEESQTMGMRFERGANKRNRDGGWFPTTDLLLISRPSNTVAAANVFFRFDLFSKTDLVLISIQQCGGRDQWFLKIRTDLHDVHDFVRMVSKQSDGCSH